MFKNQFPLSAKTIVKGFMVENNTNETREYSQTPMTRRQLLRRLGAAALALPAMAALPALAATKKAAPRWNSAYELAINLQIANNGGKGRDRRPYVAVWIEDADTVAVRTMALWVQIPKPGPRWIPDLKRWFRDEQERKAIEGGNLVSTVSSATRAPGSYRLVWNGRDDKGRLVAQGKYIVCIEAAREHGTYQLMRSEITVGASPFRRAMSGNAEIQGATLDYRKR